jgi:thymidylate synthase (FAD)
MKEMHFMTIIEDKLDGDLILKNIERYGRTCYKSEDNITDNSAKAFVMMIIKQGHESVLEHEKITVKIVCDRGVSHEIVRHRIGSYSQESTRYCNYSDEKFNNEICCINPSYWNNDEKMMTIWRSAMDEAERKYFELLSLGASPQEARSVLPNSLKTEIVITYNLENGGTFSN